MKCPSCGHSVPGWATQTTLVCPNCKTPLAVPTTKLVVLAVVLGGLPWLALTAVYPIDQPLVSMGVFVVLACVVYAVVGRFMSLSRTSTGRDQ